MVFYAWYEQNAFTQMEIFNMLAQPVVSLKDGATQNPSVMLEKLKDQGWKNISSWDVLPTIPKNWKMSELHCLNTTIQPKRK